MTAFNIVKSLRRRGNAIVGSGCYSTAVASADPRYIIKIGQSINDKWLDYYNLIVKSNMNNSCVPAVKTLYCDATYNYYVSIMERLQDSHRDYKLEELCKDYVKGWFTEQEFVDLVAGNKHISSLDELLSVLNQIKKYTDYFSESDDVEITSDSRKLDMHSGNFMYRGKQLVIIDPWCGTDAKYITDMSDWLDSLLGSNNAW
jgi:hypothetical protein